MHERKGRDVRQGTQGDRVPAGRIVSRVDGQSVVLTMPSHSARLHRFSVKVVTEFKRNPKSLGLPAQGGVMLLLDGASARPLAIIEVRTGAVSGLATKLLSRKDSKSVGLVGSGEQARTQLEAVCCVRNIEQVKVYSRHFARAKRFSQEMAHRVGAAVSPRSEPHQAVKDADIIITATNSATPVLEWVDIPQGCHINSIGTLPDRVELAPEVISKSSVYVDTFEGVLKEAGDVIRAIKGGLFSRDRIVADMSTLVRRRGLGRKQDDEVTLFKSVGFGLQDLYAASYLYDKVAANPKKFYPDVWTASLPLRRV